MKGLFVTATDTGCGKTVVSTALLHAVRARGLSAAGFKPVAAGGAFRDGILQNDDALALNRAAARDFPYPLVNPYCFEPAIAPHLAAAECGVAISIERLASACATLQCTSDLVVAEGAGGWLVPLGGGLDMQGVALALGLPVLLVVGLRLGCLNHARLTEQAILASGAPLVGWVGSQIDPGMLRLEQNVATLADCLQAPCLGILRYRPAATAAEHARVLDLDRLFGSG